MTGLIAGGFLDAAEWIETLIPVFVGVYLCHGFAEMREQRLRVCAEFVALLAAMLVVRVPILLYGRAFFENGGVMPLPAPTLLALATTLVMFGYLCLCSNMRWRTSCLCTGVIYAFNCCLFTFSGQCSYLIGSIIGAGVPEGLTRCVLQVLLIPLAAYLRKQNYDNFPVIPIGGVQLILCEDAFILIMSVLEGIYGKDSEAFKVVMAVIFVGMLFVTFASVRCIYAMCVEQAQLIDLQTERQRSHSEHEMLEWMDDNLDAMRCLRHDLKNQYAYMQILLESGRYEELKAYFAETAENLPLLQGYVDCGNSNMNTLLNLMYSKAKARNVKLSFRLVVPPVLPFKVESLCSLIGNLIDNAIEECCRLQEAGEEHAEITLEIYPQKSYLVICCQNTTNRRSLTRRIGGLRTTKTDEQLHGYGTRIVSRIAEEYNGLAEFNLEGDLFVAKVMLDMMAGESK